MVKIKASEFLKAEHVKSGDTVTFLDEGSYTESSFKDANGNPKQNFNIGVSLEDGTEKTATINWTSQKSLASSWGQETADWVGRQAKINLSETRIGSKKVTVVYYEPTDEIDRSKRKAWDESEEMSDVAANA
jgi:hypothetical protein